MTARLRASLLRASPGPCAGEAEMPAVCGADGGSDGRDLILRLECLHAEVAELGELVEDVEVRVMG